VNHLASALRTSRGAFVLAFGALLMIAGGVTAGGWMLNLPDVRVPCSESAVRVTYITPTGTYCEGSNPFEQPSLAVLAVLIGIALLIVSCRLERRVGWMVHRLTTGLTHGSVLFALSLPFVVFSLGSCGPSAVVSGYQMLKGFDLPVSDLNLSPNFAQHFGPNPAIIVLVAVAVIGLAASMWPGWKSDVVRLVSAGIGIAAVSAAFLMVPRGVVFNGTELYVDGGLGPTIIALALGISLCVDGQAVARRHLGRRTAAATILHTG
jgi:hypothetical protein